jgi:hypothetical protein
MSDTTEPVPLPTPRSPRYEQVKGYWDNYLWNETRLRNAVLKLWITAAEFTEITGIDYNQEDKGLTRNV